MWTKTSCSVVLLIQLKALRTNSLLHHHRYTLTTYNSKCLNVLGMVNIFFLLCVGIVFEYGIMQTGLWWLFHIVAIFFGILFPFRARVIRETGKCKHVHISMVIAGLLIPCIPVAATFGTGGYGITRFPPILCTAKDGAAIFYSLVLPVSLYLGTVASLLIVIYLGISKVWTAILVTLTRALVCM